ncbi:MAG: YHYH protein [Anaerolineae bacterium]|nr:YHYH protein [Anaerolineae bacterium]
MKMKSKIMALVLAGMSLIVVGAAFSGGAAPTASAAVAPDANDPPLDPQAPGLPPGIRRTLVPIVTTPTATPAPTATPSPTTAPSANAGTPFRSNVVVTVSGGAMMVSSNGLPDHAAGPFPNPSNPNSILPQTYLFRIPLTPQRATTPSDTPMGPIGVAINGVPFYNQYNAQRQDAVLVERFDSCNGHPDQRGAYHYHQLPVCMTSDMPGQHSTILGFAFDGYGIYGLQDVGGAAPTNLDTCNGHFGPTPDHPEGVYHYHATTRFPYLLGCYAGVPAAQRR